VNYNKSVVYPPLGAYSKMTRCFESNCF